MQIKSEFPRSIREIQNTWIPMSDGVKLAARIWLPEDAEQVPAPAIPYRKNDATAFSDLTRHPYFAGHGYASIRVDMRGSGDSDGILYDEYLPQEQDDALEVLSWIAAQPWCSGRVGMIGISWGGFNGLQVASRQPPELKAIITLCSTDDRYNDDCHYMGGCVLASDMLSWASIMLAYNARPPDPRFVGERWREMWLQRMEKSPPFVETWLSHQRRDAFWKHGSVGEDYGAITCPVYAVGGWADAYTNTILRLMARLSAPRKGLIGPWSHNYPEDGSPGPAIGFLQECLRWWDYWLKDIDTGIMEEPMLRVWMQESVEPRSYYAVRPGRWVAESAWPSPNIQTHTYVLNDSELDDTPAPETRLEYQGAQRAGRGAGVWCPYGQPADLPIDQRGDDGLSLTFTSPPLGEPMEILGFPEVTLTVSADKPNALVAVRLCDVAPTGSSMLVSWGLLNLTHRDSHEQPTALEPGTRYQVKVRLNAIAHAMAVGHRWRVAVSPTYWPHAWPSPEVVTLSLYSGGGSRLELPVRPPDEKDADLAPFEAPECAPPPRVEVLRSPSSDRSVRYDVVQGLSELVGREDRGHKLLLDSGLEYQRVVTNTYTIVADDPLSAQVRCARTIGIGRGDWQTRVETSSVMTADANAFHVTNLLDAYEGNTRVFTKTWAFEVPREWV
jgi:putative CocE/NonD family hydrolase